MSQPFRFLDLPPELQIKIFTFYFGAPFDISIHRACLDVSKDGGRMVKEKYVMDSRTDFCALWTSPSLVQQAQQAYQAGFSGHLDVANLQTTKGDCFTALFESIARTVPRSRVRTIALGEVDGCYCATQLCRPFPDDFGGDDPEGDYSEFREHCASMRITRTFTKITNITMTYSDWGYLTDQYRDPLLDYMDDVPKLLDGSLDRELMLGIYSTIWATMPNFGREIVYPFTRDAVVVALTVWGPFEDFVQDHQYQEHKKYLVVECNFTSVDSIQIVSRRLTDEEPPFPEPNLARQLGHKVKKGRKAKQSCRG